MPRAIHIFYCLFASIMASSNAGLAQSSQTIRIIAIADSANFQPGFGQPGSLSSIFVTGLEGPPGNITATKYPLSNELDGISVWIDSIPAPVLGVAFLNGYQQINVQVPWDSGPQVALVAQNGIQAQMAATVNAWGTLYSDANGYGIVQHAADFSMVTAQNPAHPGEYLIAYGQNFGPVTNPPASGAAAPFDPLSESLFPPEAAICAVYKRMVVGQSAVAPPLFVGLTPGTVGVYQINFQLPSSAAVGDTPMYFVFVADGPPVYQCTAHFVGSSVLLPIR